MMHLDVQSRFPIQIRLFERRELILEHELVGFPLCSERALLSQRNVLASYLASLLGDHVADRFLHLRIETKRWQAVFRSEKPGPEEGQIFVYHIHVQQLHGIGRDHIRVLQRCLKTVDREPELDHVGLTATAHEFGKEDEGRGVIEDLAKSRLVR